MVDDERITGAHCVVDGQVQAFARISSFVFMSCNLEAYTDVIWSQK